MSFVKLGNDYINNGYTQVDNVFLLQYTPTASGTDVKIYLYGLALAAVGDESDNQIEKMALGLQLSEERIMEAYSYWEKEGLISISKTNPPNVKYLSVKNPLTKVVRFNTQKYSQFVEDVERLFPEKILNQNEYHVLMTLMENERIEPEAMLLIMRYCSDLKKTLSIPYVLAVASDWAKQGLVTNQQVDEHIKELENNSEAIRSLFKALGVKRNADIEDRQIYLKWNKIYELDAMLVAAKAIKRKGGIEKLDLYLAELQNARAFSAVEIKEYTKKKENLHSLAIEINKQLGAYYSDVNVIVDTYLVNWLAMGFEENALLKLAHFCFLRNIKTYDGLGQLVQAFYKKGILTEESIEQYISKQILMDEKIMKVFAACNYYGTISGKDRKFYQTWEEWGFNDEVIQYAAEANSDKTFPMQAINRLLNAMYTKNVYDLDGVRQFLEKSGRLTKPKEDFLRHEYTEEQLKNVFVDFGDGWE